MRAVVTKLQFTPVIQFRDDEDRIVAEVAGQPMTLFPKQFEVLPSIVRKMEKTAVADPEMLKQLVKNSTIETE